MIRYLKRNKNDILMKGYSELYDNIIFTFIRFALW